MMMLIHCLFVLSEILLLLINMSPIIGLFWGVVETVQKSMGEFQPFLGKRDELIFTHLVENEVVNCSSTFIPSSPLEG